MIDFSGIKKLTIGGVELVKLFINDVQVWAMKTFTNQVPISTDTDGSIFNKVGYKENVRLSSSGSISGSAQNGSVTTGFIPFKNTDIIRLKGATWLGTESVGHYYFYLYKNKSPLTDGYASASSMADANVKSQLSVTYDSATGVTTFYIIDPTGDTGAIRASAKQATHFRINAYGKGADMIVTINEEID